MAEYTKKNINKLKPSSTLVINEKSKELINRGKKVYSFGFGQSPFPVPESIVNKLKRSEPDLKKHISELHNVRNKNEQTY